MALAIFLSRNLSQCYMAMFTAYFDESGSEDTPALVVAGFVSSADQWIRFDRDWKQILSNYGISYFHMKDFAACRGEFLSWKGQEEKRKWLLQSLTGIIKVRLIASMGMVLILKDYHEVNRRFMVKETFGNPYPLCARFSVGAVLEWAKEHRHNQPIHYVFEDGARHKGELLQRMQEEGSPLPSFGKKKDYAPLQAADFLAWEHLKAFRQHQAGKLKQFRKSMAALLGGIPNYSGIYNAESLERMCNDLPVPLRSSFPTPCP